MVIFNIYGGYTMKTIRFISILLLLSLSANIQLFGNGERKREQIAREKKEKALRIKKAQEKVRAEKSARAHKKAQILPEIIFENQVIDNNNNIIIIQEDQNQNPQNQNPIDNANGNEDNQAECQLPQKRKALKIALLSSVITGIGVMVLYPIIYKNVCENGNLEYCSKEQLCTIWNNIQACTELCNDGMLEYCTKEQLCTIWHNMAACTELCKDGIFKYCTKEQLCNIHDFWKQCPCSLEDLRGCFPAICQNLPYCPEVVTWLAETFSTTPEAIIKMFV